MATVLPMSQERDRMPPGYVDATSAGVGPSRASASASAYPATVHGTAAASLSEVASAALADVGDSDSSVDARSRGSQLVPASSNGSLGGSQTDDTSPKSAVSVVRGERMVTPEGRVGGKAVEEESPRLKQGAKRTASGAVKAPLWTTMTAVDGDLSTRPSQSYGASRGHVRTKSSSRAAEVSNVLKTRLAYAMVKVNNGWENQSLDQLEHIARRTSPSLLTSPSAASPQRRRFSMTSEYNDRYITSPDVQQSPQQFPSRSGYQEPYPSYPVVFMDASPRQHQAANHTPSLAPAAPIAPGRSHRRSLSTKAPPTLPPNLGYLRAPDDYLRDSKISTYAASQPTTPRRHGILRMPSQQAEKDALDSLLFMASPNNSANMKYTDSPAGPSPLRTEFPAAVKRVVFEN